MAVPFRPSFNPVEKPVLRDLDKHHKDRDREARIEAAYAEVDKRDGGIDQVTGQFTVPGSPDTKLARDHHHLKGRRVRPDWIDKPERIITVARRTHRLLQRHAILVEGDDARYRLVFTWNRTMVPVGKEPFRIKSKRWSQNEDR
jgi:hypothetical protein